MMPLLYLDEDSMRSALVLGLRARNVDVLTALEAGTVNRDDEFHLATATASGRVPYSFHVGDYCVLHEKWASQTRTHAGIVVAPQQRYSVGEAIRRLVRLLGSFTADEMLNRIEFLSAWQ